MAKRKLCSGLSSIFFLLLCSQLASGQSNTPVPGKAPATQAGPNRLCEQVFAEGKYLSPEDVTRLVAAIQLRKPAKDEFESTAEYQKRSGQIQKYIAASLQDKVGFPYVLVAARTGAYPPATYDADRGQLTFRFPSGYLLTTSTPINDSQLIRLSEKIVEGDSYVATNSFGAQTRVIVQRMMIVGISLYPDAGLFRRVEKPPVSVSMNPEQARSFKETAQIAVVATPEGPFFSSGTRTASPTFQNPYEVTFEYVTLAVKPLCVAVIDPGSRKILQIVEPRSRN
jgi:hypothetical protein